MIKVESQPKYKIGDFVRIINYGQSIWIFKQEFKNMFLAGFSSSEVPKNIIKETDNMYIIDIAPDMIGKGGVVKSVTNTKTLNGIIFKYSIEDVGAWYFEDQLIK